MPDSRDGRTETAFFDNLSPSEAIGTIADILGDPSVTGILGDFLYCVQNGRQVLLGHGPFHALGPGAVVSMVQYVFVSRDLHHHRHVTTWEELREYLADGWVMGTHRSSGVKIWFADNGRNYRRDAARIYVLRKPIGQDTPTVASVFIG